MSSLYIAPILHLIFPTSTELTIRMEINPITTLKVTHVVTEEERRLIGNLNVQFYVDDGLIHITTPTPQNIDKREQLSLNMYNMRRAWSYLSWGLRDVLDLELEPDKLELIHFSKRWDNKKKWSETHPLGPVFKVTHNGQTVRVEPKKCIRYLGFWIDHKLNFKQHVTNMANKGMSTVHAMRMLGNSCRGLQTYQKRVLFISNVLPVLTYGIQLWWKNDANSNKNLIKKLQNVQNVALRWITGCFRTTPIGAMEIIASITPFRLHGEKNNEKIRVTH